MATTAWFMGEMALIALSALLLVGMASLVTLFFAAIASELWRSWKRPCVVQKSR